MSLNVLKKELSDLASPKKAKILMSFFKTGKGQYGEGDVFLGIVVPDQRKIAKKYQILPIRDVLELLHSKYHEHRLTAIFILILQYQKGDQKTKEKIYSQYLKNTKYINNWDLIDLSAPKIVGDYLLNKPRDILYHLASSKNLWKRRISILATFAFIKQSDFKDTLKISELLLADNHNLIHKATGWAMREVGKKDQSVLIQFLNMHSIKMPRTMLRYSLERLPGKKRRYYMNLGK